ncbi:MAG: hypothetical protein OHK006_07590 [Thermodesulfovibrionales bacterium]
MREQISLSEDKKTVFLGACQIYAAYVRTGRTGAEDEGLFLKSVEDAIALARTVDRLSCSQGEICEGTDLWDRQ